MPKSRNRKRKSHAGTPELPATESSPLFKKIWLFGRRILSIAVIFGIISAYYSVRPSIEITKTDKNGVFDFPFLIENNALFEISNIQAACAIKEGKLNRVPKVHCLVSEAKKNIPPYTLQNDIPIFIAPQSKLPMWCSIRIHPKNLNKAVLEIAIEYEILGVPMAYTQEFVWSASSESEWIESTVKKYKTLLFTSKSSELHSSLPPIFQNLCPPQ